MKKCSSSYVKGDKVIFFGFGSPLRTEVVGATYLKTEEPFIKRIHIKGGELIEETIVHPCDIKMECTSDYYIDMLGNKKAYDIEGFLIKYNIQNVYQLENLINKI